PGCCERFGDATPGAGSTARRHTQDQGNDRRRRPPVARLGAAASARACARYRGDHGWRTAVGPSGRRTETVRCVTEGRLEAFVRCRHLSVPAIFIYTMI